MIKTLLHVVAKVCKKTIKYPVAFICLFCVRDLCILGVTENSITDMRITIIVAIWMYSLLCLIQMICLLLYLINPGFWGKVHAAHEDENNTLLRLLPDMYNPLFGDAKEVIKLTTRRDMLWVVLDIIIIIVGVLLLWCVFSELL